MFTWKSPPVMSWENTLIQSSPTTRIRKDILVSGDILEIPGDSVKYDVSKVGPIIVVF